MSKSKICFGLLVSFVFLMGCEPRTNARGNNLVSENIKKFEIGKTTTNDVLTMCGSPSLQRDRLNWIYIDATSEEVAFRKIQMKNQSVIELSFDDTGILKAINKVSHQKEAKVHFDGDITPLPAEKNKKKK